RVTCSDGSKKILAVLPTILSPLEKACVRMELTAIHDILLKTGYKDERVLKMR
ncbi:Serine/threonine-protein kinase bsk2, partial [Datura stramonium]|nr:Serine/threonine-protein kinase bsk2 [Datura stramonium]